MDYHVQ